MTLKNGYIEIRLVNQAKFNYSQKGTPVWKATGIVRHRTKEGKGWVDTPGSPTMWVYMTAFGEIGEHLADAELDKGDYIRLKEASFKPLEPRDDGTLAIEVIVYDAEWEHKVLKQPAKSQKSYKPKNEAPF